MEQLQPQQQIDEPSPRACKRPDAHEPAAKADEEEGKDKPTIPEATVTIRYPLEGFSDLTIVVDNTAFEVHKAWMARFSQYFKTLLTMDGKVKTIPLSAELGGRALIAADMQLFLDVLYGPDVDTPASTIAKIHLDKFPHVLFLAHYFNVPNMLSSCRLVLLKLTPPRLSLKFITEIAPLLTECGLVSDVLESESFLRVMAAAFYRKWINTTRKEKPPSSSSSSSASVSPSTAASTGHKDIIAAPEDVFLELLWNNTLSRSTLTQVVTMAITGKAFTAGSVFAVGQKVSTLTGDGRRFHGVIADPGPLYNVLYDDGDRAAVPAHLIHH